MNTLKKSNKYYYKNELFDVKNSRKFQSILKKNVSNFNAKIKHLHVNNCN